MTNTINAAEMWQEMGAEPGGRGYRSNRKGADEKLTRIMWEKGNTEPCGAMGAAEGWEFN